MQNWYILAGVFVIGIIFSFAIKNGNVDESYKKITGQEAKEILKKEKNVVLLDVRTKKDYDTYHLPNAIFIDKNDVESQASTKLPNKKQHIIVYCTAGVRSRASANILISLGYTNVYDLGGIKNFDS